MSLIASALKHMLAAGMPHEAIIAAVEEMEATLKPAKSARSERNARYYENHREEIRLKASERRLKNTEMSESRLNATERLNSSETSETPVPPCLDKENPPAPPKEINPNPPLPPISVGSGKPNDNVVGLFGNIEGKSGKRKPANQKPAYSPLFGLVWETFPKHPNASKQQAFTEFQRLSEDDQNLALDGAMAFQEILAETRARNPKYDPPHLSTWLHQRRFDDALEAKPQFRMYKS